MTRRQSQTLPLIRQGLSNKEIASHMGISLKTADHYVSMVESHYGARNKCHLVALLNSTVEDPRDYL